METDHTLETEISASDVVRLDDTTESLVTEDMETDHTPETEISASDAPPVWTIRLTESRLKTRGD